MAISKDDDPLATSGRVLLRNPGHTIAHGMVNFAFGSEGLGWSAEGFEPPHVCVGKLGEDDSRWYDKRDIGGKEVGVR